MITQKQAENFIYQLLSQVWCQRNKNAVTDFYHPEFLGILNGQEKYCFDDVLQQVDYSKERYINNQFILHEVFLTEQENHFVTRFSMQSFDNKEQQLLDFHFMVLIEMQVGKMIKQCTLSSIPYRYKAWE